MLESIERPRVRRTLSLSLFLLHALAVVSVLISCRAPTDRSRLRLGYFANLTHAPAITGVASGRFARDLAGVRLETRVLNAGPAAIEALLCGELDMAYVGPAPLIAGWVRTRGAGPRVVAGATSGGALFVLRDDVAVRTPDDLRGRTLATPQLGNSQDVALRRYLRDRGLPIGDGANEVRVLAMHPSEILSQFRLGRVHGAWVAEPWGTRLLNEARGRLYLDERTLWPARRFATALLVASREYLRDAPENVRAMVRANQNEIFLYESGSSQRVSELRGALAALFGRPLRAGLITESLERMNFTTDTMDASLRAGLRSAMQLGFVPHGDLRGLIADLASPRDRRSSASVRAEAVLPSRTVPVM